MNVFQNYHKHSWDSNISTPDSATAPDEYVKRALELGHRVISSVEHGWQGQYYKIYELVINENKKLQKRRDEGEQNVPLDLKFVFGTEAYWVKDRFEKDSSNCHIILLAKNEEGRRDINDVLSEANISGYYNKPRLDIELLKSIKPSNVMVTSACLGFWKYDDIENIVIELKNHFKDNFYLEIQYHDTVPQKKLNENILLLSKKHNIEMIMGCDSHYILESDFTERDNYLEARGIKYEEEKGWYLDYPTYKIAFERFKKQNVFTDAEIYKAMNNTNIILDFEDITFDKNIKLPTLHKEKTQEWKDKYLRQLISKAWKTDFEPYINPLKKQEYLKGIYEEYRAIIDTKMTDYFLLDYEIVKQGKELGGIISKTARGSGGSYYLNTLLGFSNLDRFVSPVKLYPERFMSKTRILETKSLPDLDLNLGNVEVFAEVQKELLGENHAYPMVAFGRLQTSSAFKMYCKSQGVEFDIANEITKQIKKYEKDLKNAEEDEKDSINVYDYVSSEYHSHLDESKKYQGITNSKVKHPCGYLIYQGDIRREIGLLKCKSDSTKKEYITTVIDGYVAEEYKFVKNDLLKVDVANSIKAIYDRVGIEQHSILELTKIIENDSKTWDIYANGYTLGVNQMESDFGRQCCKQYKPKNVGEITALVSALRPGFKSMLQTFLKREPYTTGVKALDSLLEDSFHFIMYQENIMTYLGWLGIEQTETYAIIKKISKKKFKAKELDELKSKLLKSWINNTGNSDGFEESFKVVEDFSLYAFNASHAYAYAYDSLYGAYLKANHPYEFYATMLQMYTNKGKKDKVTAYKNEMKEAFDIDEGDFKWGNDNRQFTIDKNNKCINPSLSSIKDMGKNVADELYTLSQTKKYSNFYEVLKEVTKTSCNTKMLDILIRIEYFSEFGGVSKLLNFVNYFNLLNGKKAPKKATISANILDKNIIKIIEQNSIPTAATYTKFDSDNCLNEIWCKMGDSDMSIVEKIINKKELLGNITYVNPLINNKVFLVTSLDTTYSPVLKLYSLNNGKEYNVKVNKKDFTNNPFDENSIIHIGGYNKKPAQSKVGTDKNGRAIFKPDESKPKVVWVTTYTILDKEDIVC